MAKSSSVHPVPTLELLPFADALKRSGFSRSWLYDRIAAGDVEARKLGRSIRIVAASLETYLASAPPAVIRPSRRQRNAAARAPV